MYGKQVSMMAVICRVGKRMQHRHQQDTSRGIVVKVRTWQPKVDAIAPNKVCVDEGQAPQCTELNVVPAAAVEDVWQITSDAAVLSSVEGKDDAHKYHEEW